MPCVYIKGTYDESKLIIYFHSNAEDLISSFDFVKSIGKCTGRSVLVVEYPGYSVYKNIKPESNTYIQSRFIQIIWISMEKLNNFWRDWIWCYKSYWIYERGCRFQSQRYINNWSIYWIRACCLYCIYLSCWLLSIVESIPIPMFCCQRFIWLILRSIDNWKIQ